MTICLPQQVLGPGAVQGQRQRTTFKFQHNVRNQPQAHPGAVSMQPQELSTQTMHMPVSTYCLKLFKAMDLLIFGNSVLVEISLSQCLSLRESGGNRA